MIIWPSNSKKAVANIAIAKGIVSKRGASELSSPSLFNPLLRFTNEPHISPIMQEKPSIKPIVNAANDELSSPPKNQNQSPESA